MDSLKEAEAVKIVENSFRDINIAFVNELAMSFSKLGIDVINVIDGAATKPFAFMAHYPGCGIGGHCIPVDPYYLISYARKNGFHHDFLSLAR
ncbi:MAG: nucleotide sugar dehydrogenase [Candidatus Berkelbacteria bacterium]|nr:nucleotide sugar dehydrogenase [Candidatus Berkelbacteria bacterium]